MEGEIRTLLVLAFLGLAILLRFDAARFGAAEYDDETAPGGWRLALRRLTWYLLGIALIAALYRLHDRPVATFNFTPGDDRIQVVFGGLAYGIFGTLVAIGFAYWRYQRFRLPAFIHYPGGVINSIGTAFIDEAVFRGALLGLLLTSGWTVELAIALQAILYGLATRLGAPGRSWGMLAISLGIGVVGGYMTVLTGGIGAAILGHAITRFTIFVTTGHAGQVRPRGWASERFEAETLPPEGWEVVSQADDSPYRAAWYPFPSGSVPAAGLQAGPSAPQLGDGKPTAPTSPWSQPVGERRPTPDGWESYAGDGDR
ncbi:MAG: CPBP family intramembrane metalloprotease [Chloroflexi bacterium]|nr:CPBP family intramembrane metalloprotease [Chloroflexota bacterium]